jgi:hypothetical protein
MPNEPIVLKVLERHSRLKEIRVPWESHWDEISDRIVPRHNIYHKTKGVKRRSEIYDSTAPRANARLAASLHSMLTNPSQKWLSMKVEPAFLLEDRDVLVWLEETQELVMDAINDSNFHTKAHEFYLDLPSLGTGVLFHEENDDPDGPDFVFHTLPLIQCAVLENHKGQIDVLHREFRMSARNVVKSFGEKACNDKILDLAQNKPEEEVQIIHAVFPKDDYDKYNKLEKPYASVWIATQWKHLLKESGYYEFPAYITRWQTASGEIWGRGPGMEALPDIKTSNAMTKDLLESTELIVKPPLDMEFKSYINPLNTSPSHINQRVRGAQKVEPLYLVDGNAIPITDSLLEKVKASINDTFFYDAINLIKADRMTATEVMQRVEENMRILGPTYSRLQHEFLEPLVMRSYGILKRRGKLPPPPDTIARAGGYVKIEYESPMARAQRTSDIMAIQRTISLVAPVAEAVPQILDNYDFDEMARHIARITGLPQKMVKDSDRVQEERQQRAQAQQAQMMAAVAKDAAGAAKTASEIKPSTLQEALG